MNIDVDPPGLIRIEITARGFDAAQAAVEGISKLWLSSSTQPRRVPGEDGVHVTVHADMDRSAAEGGYLEPPSAGDYVMG